MPRSIAGLVVGGADDRGEVVLCGLVGGDDGQQFGRDWPSNPSLWLRRVLPNQPVDRFADEVGMTDVAGVLLDHVR